LIIAESQKIFSFIPHSLPLPGPTFTLSFFQSNLKSIIYSPSPMLDYKLSQSILTEGSPVRSIAFTPTHLISGSESGTLSSTALSLQETGTGAESSSSSISLSSPRLLDPNGTVIQPGGEGTRHSHHITALIDLPDGGYATGCKDHIIRLFDSRHALVGKLEGHENAVTSLSTVVLPCKPQGSVGTKENDSDSDRIIYITVLLSGSWDGTAKLWNLQNGKCIATIPGHENTVSVQGLPPVDCSMGKIATGSAGVARGNVISDYKIRLWEVVNVTEDLMNVQVNLKCTVGNDHNGPIRDLAYDPLSQMLLSCSNDGTVKVRDTVTGEAVATLEFPFASFSQSQPPMLLSVDCTEMGNIVASSEDGNVIVWNVSAMESGSADAVQVIEHPNCVWKVLKARGGSGDFISACHDGMIRVFTMDDKRVAPEGERAAFQDSVLEAKARHSTGPSREEIEALPKWEMNALQVGKSEGQVQVFNKNGKAIAAQWSAVSGTWIEVGEVTGRNENAGTINGIQYDHVLPIEIDLASGGVQRLQIGYNNGENPFTVAQKFIDDNMLDQGYLAQIADYIRSRVGEAAGPTIGMDSGTTNSANMNVSSGPVPMDIVEAPTSNNTYKYIPMKGYKSFETGTDRTTLEKVYKKIEEFNSCPNNNLTPNELSSVLNGLCQTIAATNRYHATTVTDVELSIILKMMSKWPLENVFPSLDLARLVVIHPDASKASRSAFWDKIVTCALDRCEELRHSNLSGPPNIAIPMLSFRLFANCFRGGAGSQSAVELHLAR
jgi:FOG: WD40 repeat